MKKTLSLLLLLSMVFVTALPSFAAEPRVRPNAMAELYSVEGMYTDSVGNREAYSFHVPLLAADTADAEEINAEIRERFGKLVEKQLGNMEKGYSLWSWCVEWNSTWYGSQLFLLVSAKEEGGFTDYAAYGYDFESGERVTNEQILSELGISEQTYLENLREKVQIMFEDMFSVVAQEDREAVGYDAMLEKTLAWADMSQPMLIGVTGDVMTIVKIASIAGAEWYYHIATPFSYG